MAEMGVLAAGIRVSTLVFYEGTDTMFSNHDFGSRTLMRIAFDKQLHALRNRRLPIRELSSTQSASELVFPAESCGLRHQADFDAPGKPQALTAAGHH